MRKAAGQCLAAWRKPKPEELVERAASHQSLEERLAHMKDPKQSRVAKSNSPDTVLWLQNLMVSFKIGLCINGP